MKSSSVGSALAKHGALFGVPSIVAVLTLAAISPSPVRAACGGLDQKACCICDRSNPCDSGLFEICGCDSCVGCNTGNCEGVACAFIPPFPPQANGYCVDLSPCGGLDQRACCVGEGAACQAGLTEQGSCKDTLGRKECGCDGGPLISAGVCRNNGCGGAGERACCIGQNGQGALGAGCDAGKREVFIPPCGVAGAPGCGGCSISWCAAITPCGGNGERACCLGEGSACDSGFLEKGNCANDLGLLNCGGCSIGVCRPKDCGGAGQRACCLNEQITLGQGPCDSGLVERGSCASILGSGNCGGCSIGVCVDITDCGGLGERACCVLEAPLIGACESGLIENGDCGNVLGETNCFCGGVSLVQSSGVCAQPDCGGDGERGCCLLERIPSCDAGLIEDLSPAGPFSDCEDALGAGNCDCGFGPGTSLGVCRALKGLGETGCDNIFDPCASGLVCLATDTGTICVPKKGDGLFGDDVCAAFYNPLIHQGAIASGLTLSFGTGASASAGVTGSVEVGVAYGADGCYGCYFTKCYGVETDIAIGLAACTGQGFDGLFSSVAGDSCSFTVGADFPLLEIGGSVSSEWDGSGVSDCFSSPQPDASSACFSIGLGLNPVTAAFELCNTVSNLVACNDAASGDIVPTPDEAPVCFAGSEYGVCPGSSIALTPMALDPDGDPLTYHWTTDCPGGTFNNVAAAAPILSFNPTPSCGLDCSVTLIADGTVTADGTTTPAQVICSAAVLGDGESPEFTSFPENVLIECGSSTAPANTGGSPTAADACDVNPTVSSSDSIDPCQGNERMLTRTWTLMDACGNLRSRDQLIRLSDITAPSILCGAGPTVVARVLQDPPIFATATASDACCPGAATITQASCIGTGCDVEYAGDTLTINATGAQGSKINWTVETTDCCGHRTIRDCNILVVRPSAFRTTK